MTAVGPTGSGRSDPSNTFSFLNCAFTVSPTSQSMGAGGGSGTASVTTTSGCTWTATSRGRLDHRQPGERQRVRHGQLHCDHQHRNRSPHRHLDDCRTDLHRHAGGGRLRLQSQWHEPVRCCVGWQRHSECDHDKRVHLDGDERGELDHRHPSRWERVPIADIRGCREFDGKPENRSTDDRRTRIYDHSERRGPPRAAERDKGDHPGRPVATTRQDRTANRPEGTTSARATTAVTPRFVERDSWVLRHFLHRNRR